MARPFKHWTLTPSPLLPLPARKASRRKEKFCVVSVEQAVDDQKRPQQLICYRDRVLRQLVALIHHWKSCNSLKCFHVWRWSVRMIRGTQWLRINCCSELTAEIRDLNVSYCLTYTELLFCYFFIFKPSFLNHFFFWGDLLSFKKLADSQINKTRRLY